MREMTNLLDFDTFYMKERSFYVSRDTGETNLDGSSKGRCFIILICKGFPGRCLFGKCVNSAKFSGASYLLVY